MRFHYNQLIYLYNYSGLNQWYTCHSRKETRFLFSQLPVPTTYFI